MALRRLNKELSDLQKEKIEHGDAAPSGEDMYNWVGHVNGPHDSPYEGHKMPIAIKFPQEYPFKGPEVKFTCQMFHPNINVDGVPCGTSFVVDWRPAITLARILQELYSLLADPNLKEPVNAEAGQLLTSNPSQYAQRVRELARKGSL